VIAIEALYKTYRYCLSLDIREIFEDYALPESIRDDYIVRSSFARG